jgi:hypothetical protein
MLKTRVEFIGLQNGETVSGHIYARDWGEVNQFFKDNSIEEAIHGYAGFVPVDLILPHSICKVIVTRLGRDAGEVLHEFNKWALELIQNEDI